MKRRFSWNSIFLSAGVGLVVGLFTGWATAIGAYQWGCLWK